MLQISIHCREITRWRHSPTSTSPGGGKTEKRKKFEEQIFGQCPPHETPPRPALRHSWRPRSRRHRAPSWKRPPQKSPLKFLSDFPFFRDHHGGDPGGAKISGRKASRHPGRMEVRPARRTASDRDRTRSCHRFWPCGNRAGAAGRRSAFCPRQALLRPR